MSKSKAKGDARPSQKHEHVLHQAVTGDGTPLPYSPDQVQEKMREITATGRLMAVIFETVSGAVAVEVFGPPSAAILDTLEQTTTAYRAILRGRERADW